MSESQRPGWALVLKKDDKSNTLELSVYDVIGKDFWTGEGVTAAHVLEKLRGAPDAKKIVIRINSIGGLVDEAKAMVNLLRERAEAGVEIEAHIDGIAASAASYLTTAADRVFMPDNAFLMIHAARAGMRGTQREMERARDTLAKVDDQIATAYAEASARRGKKKTKADYLALMADGDHYFTASEAVELGLADATTEAIQVAACAVDLDGLDAPPEALRLMPYVVRQSSAATARQIADQAAVAAIPGGCFVSVVDGLVTFATGADTFALKEADVVRGGVDLTRDALAAAYAAIERRKQITPPHVAAEQPTNVGEERSTMTFPKSLLKILNLADDADEAAVVAAATKLGKRAEAMAQIENVVGESGDRAVGAVRALREAKEQHETLSKEISEVKVKMNRKELQALLAQGQDPKKRKLTPVMAKRYSENFDKDVEAGGDGSAVIREVEGHLSVAATITGSIDRQTRGDGSEGGALAFNGKSYANMTPMERHALWSADKELFNEMRRDWQAAGSPGPTAAA